MKLTLILAVILLSRATNADLTVKYCKYQLQEIEKIPTANPFLVSTADGDVACSVKCSLDEKCLSFYYGFEKCGLFHSKETVMNGFPGYRYYQMSDAKAPESIACTACPFGVEERIYINGDSAYIMCPATTTWPLAEAACSCTGARLVNIPDAETQKVAEELAVDLIDSGTTLPASFWIGINGTGQGSGNPYTFTRSDGEILQRSTPYFDKWFPGEPDINGKVGVAILSQKGADFGKWVDTVPTDLRGYLCEFIG